MKQELALIRKGIVDRTEPIPFMQNRENLDPFRRLIRESSDDLIHDGLMANGVPAFAERIVRFMLDAASLLDRVGLEPELDEFVGAAISLVQLGRDGLDKGLMIHDAATVNTAAVIVEITVHGLCAVLGLNYNELLPIVHGGDPEAFRDYMRLKGHIPNEPIDSQQSIGDPGTAG